MWALVFKLCFLFFASIIFAHLHKIIHSLLASSLSLFLSLKISLSLSLTLSHSLSLLRRDSRIFLIYKINFDFYTIVSPLAHHKNSLTSLSYSLSLSLKLIHIYIINFSTIGTTSTIIMLYSSRFHRCIGRCRHWNTLLRQRCCSQPFRSRRVPSNRSV